MIQIQDNQDRQREFEERGNREAGGSEENLNSVFEMQEKPGIGTSAALDEK